MPLLSGDTEFRDILYEQRGNVAWITINRPKQLNAFTGDTLKELTLALEDAVVVVRATDAVLHPLAGGVPTHLVVVLELSVRPELLHDLRPVGGLGVGRARLDRLRV